MIGILSNTAYARLFGAQVIALAGTGLLTIALGLLAYDLAGDRAGAVLGTALTIKMVAYVALAPVANAIAVRLPRKALLIGADLIRAAVALCLPFIGSIWQVYVLIFVLQAASATFTPAFQATIPDILEDEADYTKALSLSRLAYELENLFSPALAGLLLLVTSYHWLFGGTFAGFLGSALLVWLAPLPARKAVAGQSFVERLTRGLRIYLATPRLRGLLALNMAAAAASAFVIVNTVVVVKAGFGGTQTDVAIAFGAFGVGSMIGALSLPRLLEHLSDRPVMIASALALSVITLAHAFWLLGVGRTGWPAFLAIWAISGVFYSALLTPSGRLLRRSAHAEDRPAVFAAQFALSHACWLVTYPLAGWVGVAFGLPVAMLVLGILALLGVAAAAIVWPAGDPREATHAHPDLPPDHPHLDRHDGVGTHRHELIIDDIHRAWPAKS
ncbi:MFS transporter [Mesorhizobium sp. Z1-4]|uniref:MFS transporter n=1 Tax=Mesorhizobium sp. Z1-4 TaxID=2448478 RepID=UPI000FD7023D|nr:MFS transporter [Mesorhizobium sp. Z1-4]